MCIYAITIMHKCTYILQKTKQKNRASIFDIFLVCTQQMGWFILLLALFPPKKLECSSFLSWEREAKKRDPFFKICVSFKISQEEEGKSLTSILLKREPRRWTFRWRLRAKSSLNWFRQNYFPKFEHFDWLNSEIIFDN